MLSTSLNNSDEPLFSLTANTFRAALSTIIQARLQSDTARRGTRIPVNHQERYPDRSVQLTHNIDSARSATAVCSIF
jgi:hypothetical protein